MLQKLLKRLFPGNSRTDRPAAPTAAAAASEPAAAPVPPAAPAPAPAAPHPAPSQPVSYSLAIGHDAYSLQFAQKREPLRMIGVNLRGYTYSLGERTCEDVATFQQETVEEISEYLQVNRDSFGQLVLRVRTPLPTFDSGDRVWDSVKLEFLVFDGRQVDLVVCRRGYQIGSIVLYEGLFAAEAGLKPWLERLEFPTEGIRWLEEERA